jgi:ribosome-binding factor A
MKRPKTRKPGTLRPNQISGASQRQLRAGELVRHALVEIMREHEIQDPALAGISVTLTEVRLSPDLRHALCFVEPLGAGVVGVEGNLATGHGQDVVDALNRSASFLRGHLGRMVDLKFTPDLKFLHDESFAEAARMNRLFASPEVRRDLSASDTPASVEGQRRTEQPGAGRASGSFSEDDQ